MTPPDFKQDDLDWDLWFMRVLCDEARKEDDAKASAASEPLSFAHEATIHRFHGRLTECRTTACSPDWV